MNNNTIPTSPTHQWMDNIQMPYNYQQTDFGVASTPYENFSQLDSTIMTTTSPPNYATTYPSSHVTSSDNQYSNLSPDNSSGNGDPKTSSASKPVRRRSRASKKKPTTLVNASISNFRAVVQQYTGCPIKNQKGPINLSFGPQTDIDGNESSSIGEASQYGYYYNSQSVQEMNGSPAGNSNYSGTSMFGVEDYGCQ